MSEPDKKFSVGEQVNTPIGELPVLEIQPILHGADVVNWLYVFGEDYDEKFTEDELLT